MECGFFRGMWGNAKLYHVTNETIIYLPISERNFLRKNKRKHNIQTVKRTAELRIQKILLQLSRIIDKELAQEVEKDCFVFSKVYVSFSCSVVLQIDRYDWLSWKLHSHLDLYEHFGLELKKSYVLQIFLDSVILSVRENL